MNNITAKKTSVVIVALAAVALGGMLTGCKTSGVEGSATAVTTPEGDMQMSKFVIINNPKLAKGLQIVDLKSVFVGDILKGQVTLVSKYAATLKFQYKFAWFNKDGIEINPDSGPWTPLIMYGNESKTIQSVAPNSGAREFKIKIRAR